MINLLSDLFALAASLCAHAESNERLLKWCSPSKQTPKAMDRNATHRFIVANIIKIKHNKKKNGGYISH
ncbi:MAG: hypothetical protein ACFNVK_04355 [Prevotella sp.]